MNPVLRRLRFRRFSTVQLLIPFLVVFICALLSRKSKVAILFYRFCFRWSCLQPSLLSPIANASWLSQLGLPFQPVAGG